MIVVVFGVSAIGKSTLGRALADALGWPFVEGDDFHPESNLRLMAAGKPLGDVERAPWLDALARSIGECAGRGGSAVYACSALKRRYRAALLAYAPAAHEVRFVHLHAPREVVEQRLEQRRGHFFPASLIDSQFADLEMPTEDEPAPVLTVDATHPVGALVAEICEWLRASPAG